MLDAPFWMGLFARYGCAMIVTGTFVEGETVVLLAGVLAREGVLSPFSVGLSAFAGAVLSDECFFYLGRRSGPAWRKRFPRADAAVERFSRYLLAHEASFIFLFRFVWGMRMAAPVFLGAHGVSPARFMLFNTIGAGLWAALFTVAGYAVGGVLERFLGRMRAEHHLALALLLGLVLAAGIVRVFMKVRGEKSRGGRKKET